MCLLGILLSYYLQFQKQSKVLEQRAYYVRSKLVMGNPAVETDYDNFQISYEKVENELRYIDDKNILWSVWNRNICRKSSKKINNIVRVTDGVRPH